nr:hypothetical protein [Burkholderia anthina]
MTGAVDGHVGVGACVIVSASPLANRGVKMTTILAFAPGDAAQIGYNP